MEAAQYSVKRLHPQNLRPKYDYPLNHRLKMARIKKEMSAQAVVDALKKKGVDISHSSLQGYETDEDRPNHRYPSIHALVALAKFYGCSLDYLFGLTDDFALPRKKKKAKVQN
jgi:transcriptional regulator with XRE-family HTH domain